MMKIGLLRDRGGGGVPSKEILVRPLSKRMSRVSAHKLFCMCEREGARTTCFDKNVSFQI